MTQEKSYKVTGLGVFPKFRENIYVPSIITRFYGTSVRYR